MAGGRRIGGGALLGGGLRKMAAPDGLIQIVDCFSVEFSRFMASD
jgi:hypothetical protein